MKRFITPIALAIIMLVLASPANATGTECAAPEGSELVEYPVLKGTMTSSFQAKKGLRLVRLEEDTMVLNYHGEKRSQCFTVEELDAGTLVFVDETDTIRYKQDCSNRLIEVVMVTPHEHQALMAWVETLERQNEELLSELSDLNSAAASDGDSSEGEDFAFMDKLLGFLWRSLLILILLTVIGFVLWWLYALWRDRNKGKSGDPDDGLSSIEATRLHDRIDTVEAMIGGIEEELSSQLIKLKSRVDDLENPEPEGNGDDEEDDSEDDNTSSESETSAHQEGDDPRVVVGVFGQEWSFRRGQSPVPFIRAPESEDNDA